MNEQALRMECLKVALEHFGDRNIEDVLAIAKKLYDFAISSGGASVS